jgi:transketolase N-terminal domain/subunit
MVPKPIKAEFRAFFVVVVRCNGLKLEELIAPFQNKNRLEEFYIHIRDQKPKTLLI